MSYKTIKEFKAQFNFVEYIESKYQVTHRGANVFILCPFHQENSPSCKINSTGFYCFGCGEHGDCLTFLIETTGRTIPDILDSPDLNTFFLSQENRTGDESKSKKIYNAPSPALINNFQKNLIRHPSKKKYLYDRHVRDSTIKGACIGYGVPLDFKYFSLPRYTIPVFSYSGLPVTMRYRIDPKHDDGSEPKYLGHPNTPSYLYNINVLKRYKDVIYVGSEFDAAALYWEYGIPAVAPPGENVFKKTWLSYFNRKRVLIWLDNDSAGNQGSLTVYNAIKEVVEEVYIYPWPPSEVKVDIGDFLKQNGPNAIFDVLNQYNFSWNP